MPALICGSLAYDTIMVFQDQFKNHILPDKVHILNVAFLVPRMRKEFGGCAGNISYNLKLLGGHPVPMGTVGQDFGPYREHFTKCEIDLSQIKVIDDLYTAQAFITTDLDDNQITAFHPGAMMRSFENHVRDVPDVKFGIVGPDGQSGHRSSFRRRAHQRHRLVGVWILSSRQYPRRALAPPGDEHTHGVGCGASGESGSFERI